MKHHPDPRLPEDVLAQVYGLVAETKEDAAIDLVYDYADNCFYAGEFLKVNWLLETGDLNRLGVHGGLALATAAHWARPHLPARVAYIERLRAFFLRIRSEEETRQILKGLE